jgi:hypothetical protein
MPSESIAYDVATLFAETGVGTAWPTEGIGGTKIFTGFEPDVDPGTNKVLTETVSIFDLTGSSEQLLTGQFEQEQEVQVRVRGMEYRETYAKIQGMIKRLRDWSRVGGFTFNDSHYLGFVRISTPTPLGQDIRRRFLFSFSFTAMRSYNDNDVEDSGAELPTDVG